MKRIVMSVAGAIAAAVMAVPAFAVNDTPGQKVTSSTTLDACGYFVGTQTANQDNHLRPLATAPAQAALLVRNASRATEQRDEPASLGGS